MLMDADEVELVLLRRAEVKAADVLVELVGLYRAVGIAVGAQVRCRNIRLDQIDRDGIERGRGYLTGGEAGCPCRDARDATGNADGCGDRVLREGGSRIVAGELR